MKEYFRSVTGVAIERARDETELRRLEELAFNKLISGPPRNQRTLSDELTQRAQQLRERFERTGRDADRKEMDFHVRLADRLLQHRARELKQELLNRQIELLSNHRRYPKSGIVLLECTVSRSA